MFCPQTIVHNERRLLIMRHERADYMTRAPLGERLNLLRYSLTFWPGTPRHWTINKNGRLALLWSNFNWHLWRKHIADVRRIYSR
jgi:hypothetical protein